MDPTRPNPPLPNPGGIPPAPRRVGPHMARLLGASLLVNPELRALWLDDLFGPDRAFPAVDDFDRQIVWSDQGVLHGSNDSLRVPR